jgi:uncharacterized protein YndB with AHSA1/START domain
VIRRLRHEVRPVPGKRYSIVARARTEAAASTVFALLKDGSTWPRWTIFSTFRLERSGRDELSGIGAVRVLTTPLGKVREEIVELVPNRRLSYAFLSGLPLRNYLAEVDLERLRDSTIMIVWQASFEAKYPGTGWFWRWLLGRVIKRVAEDLASGANDPRVAGVIGPQS